MAAAISARANRQAINTGRMIVSTVAYALRLAPNILINENISVRRPQHVSWQLLPAVIASARYSAQEARKWSDCGGGPQDTRENTNRVRRRASALLGHRVVKARLVDNSNDPTATRRIYRSS